MTPESVITIGQSAIEVALVLISFILLPTLAVGLVISMFQAATQINEQTLSFIPKLIVTFLVIMFGAPWMLQVFINYTTQLIAAIPSQLG